MKIIPLTIALSSMLLFSCGGSEGDAASEIPNNDSLGVLLDTSWKKDCFPYDVLSSDGSTVLWYVNVKLSIDFSLKSTYKTEYFRPTDTTCDSKVFDSLGISKFEITGKVISEESIVSYGLNETFIYNSEDRDSSEIYTLIYIDSEKLYFGQPSGLNIGETPQTRHSSISLDNYFSQIFN
mgnify:CR=1 FL=1